MSELITQAANVARAAHRKQVRKYTGESYFNHCAEVAIIVIEAGGTDAMIAAALLHDVVEDTEISLDTIVSMFGDEVGRLVEMLTDVSKPSDGNRETRKRIDREHTAKASPEAKTIKLADLISNTQSIVKYDPDFAKVYLKEKELLLEVLTAGDPVLYERAKALLQQGQESLVQRALEPKSPTPQKEQHEGA